MVSNDRFDYLIVGAGFAGSVLAERLASKLGKTVLLCDKREHIGGNAYDYKNEAGILVHKYGPHVFHTDCARTFQYLSQFTPWRPYQHRTRPHAGGMEDRCFTDRYQVMPLFGYTRMFETMLDHPNIQVATGVDYKDIGVKYGQMIFTGPIDAYFDYRHGKLPYRSAEFRHETHDREFYQPTAVVTYPSGRDYTRVTEFKYLTGQKHTRTTVAYEYPKAEGEPYYPVGGPESAALYKKYKDLAASTKNVRFVGRLASYKYQEMDQVVAQSLACFDQIASAAAAEPRAA